MINHDFENLPAQKAANLDGKSLFRISLDSMPDEAGMDTLYD
jgi:hypothetical protein